jgi:hypothetical protein
MSASWSPRITAMDCLKSALLAYTYDSRAILQEASRLTAFEREPFQLSDQTLLDLLFAQGGKVIGPFLVEQLTGLDQGAHPA